MNNKINTKIYVPDIECDSCVKLIEKRFKSEKRVGSFTINDDSIELNHNDALKPETLIKNINELGFRASLHPFDRKKFGERLRDFKENKNKYKIEYAGLKYVLGVFLILTIIEIIAYFGFLNNIPDFLKHYGIYLFYLNFSIAILGGGVWHFLSYKGKVTCMVGMMIGMTFGMQAGMMLGIILGATNGFFIGALFGMIIGVFIGTITGKCCGIMGAMQGMMAGVMGGTMGPMISVMMFTDNLHIFLPPYMLINAAIIIGLSYMFYEEVVEGKELIKTPLDFVTFAAASIIIAFILLAIMIYGPKSAVVSF